MRKNYLLILKVTVAVAFLYLSGCKKDSTQQPANILTDKTSQASNNPGQDELIPTPGGLRLKSQVHLIEPGAHMSVVGGHVLKVLDETGKVMADFGQARTTNINTQETPALQNLNSSNAPLSGAAGNANWQTFASWNNTSGQPITSFNTTWKVPTAPSTNHDQVIYLFNGLAQPDQHDIMQPVLQWGNNHVFGGNYWLISNWYVWDTGAAYTTTISPIAPNTSLIGMLTYTGQANGSYNYTSSFSGYGNSMSIVKGTQYHDFNLPGSNVAIPTVNLQTWAYETMEVYHWVNGVVTPEVTQSTDYPADLDVQMTNVQLYINHSPASGLSWTTTNGPYAVVGEHTNIVNGSSSSGEVDLYFHPQLPATPLINGHPYYQWTPPGYYQAGSITGAPGSLVHITISAYGPGDSINFTMDGPPYGAILSGPMGNHVVLANGTTTQTFYMPGTGYVYWSATAVTTSGSTGISVY